MGVGANWAETECYRRPNMRATERGLLPLYVCCGYVLSVLTLVLFIAFRMILFNSLTLQNVSLVIPHLPQKEETKQYSAG